MKTSKQYSVVWAQTNEPIASRTTANKRMGGVNQKTSSGLSKNLNMLRSNYRGSYNRGRNTLMR